MREGFPRRLDSTLSIGKSRTARKRKATNSRSVFSKVMPKRKSDGAGGSGSMPGAAGERKKRKKKKNSTTEGIETPSSLVRMRVGGDTGIVLATFPGGPPAPGTLLGRKAGPAETASWKLLGNTRDRHETLVGSTKRMQWFARSEEGIAARGLKAADIAGKNQSSFREDTELALSNASPVSSCYMVGVFNRTTHRLHLHYAGDRLHALEQSVRKLASVSPKKNAFEGISYRDQREELTLGFGSQGSKAGLRRMKRNVLTEDNVGSTSYLKSQISGKQTSANETVGPSSPSSVSASSRNAQAEDKHRRSMLPPYNTSATTPEEAYPFDKFLPENDNKFLDKLVKKIDRDLFKRTEKDEEGQAEAVWEPKSYFIRNRLSDLQNNFNEGSSAKARRRKALKGLVFLSHLLSFSRFRRTIKPLPDMASLAEERGIPLPLFKRFLATFATQTEYSGKPSENGEATPAFMYLKSERHEKSLLLWILITYLHTESFKAKSLDKLASELRKSPKDLAPLCKYIGAKAKSAGKKNGTSDYSVTLQVPLAFPVPSKGPRGKRK